MTSIEARYKVVTPLFSAGAHPGRPGIAAKRGIPATLRESGSPELRLASFKGVLRFWWRVLAWSRCGGNLAVIRSEEDFLFGSSDGGQSRVSMRLAERTPSPEPVTVGEVLRVPRAGRAVGPGARYLGYGVMESFDGKNTVAGRLTRACLQAPFRFTVQMRVCDVQPQRLESLKKALIALGTFGGMGAKNRKGYGSLALQKLRVDGKEWRKPRTAENLRDAIASLSGGRMDRAASLPDYTALSDRSRHLVLTSHRRQPLELLDLIGREMVRYRSWGHRGRVFGQVSEKNFEDDHDLMKQDKGQRKSHPRRIAFGLPHNYGRPRHKQIGPADNLLDRRASPLFIHIDECGKIPVAVVSFLPARFLPDGKSDISVGGKRIRQKPESDLYRPVCGFLERLLNADERKERFTRVINVRR